MPNMFISTFIFVVLLLLLLLLSLLLLLFLKSFVLFHCNDMSIPSGTFFLIITLYGSDPVCYNFISLQDKMPSMLIYVLYFVCVEKTLLNER